MSSGLNLQYVKKKDGEWYYLIERGDAPKQTWDWREYSTCFGPFKTAGVADRHYRTFHGNTGGCEYADARDHDPVMDALIAEAPKNMRNYASWQPYAWDDEDFEPRPDDNCE